MPRPKPDPLAGLPGRLAGLSALAARVNAEARRERYTFGRMSRVECRLLYEMLRSVGATDRDEVLAALVEHMARAGYAAARAGKHKRSAARAGEG